MVKIQSCPNVYIYIFLVDLPKVNLTDDQEKPRFYGGIMPGCEGLAKGWKYKIETKFSLNATNPNEYYLHVNETNVCTFFYYENTF